MKDWEWRNIEEAAKRERYDVVRFFGYVWESKWVILIFGSLTMYLGYAMTHIHLIIGPGITRH